MMKAGTPLPLTSLILVVGLLVLAGVFADARPASAQTQEACPLPDGMTPPADPPVTAQQVEDGSASLKDFALAARDRLDQEIGTGLYLYDLCLIRQEGGAYRSGSTYLILLTLDGRVYVHAKEMALGARLLNPLIYAEILSKLGVEPAVLADLASPDPATAAQAFGAVMGTLSQGPDAAFDATSLGIPSASGYATSYYAEPLGLPLIMLAGSDLDSSHMAQEEIDYGNPTVTARDVVDRETLKAFVTQAGEYVLEFLMSGDLTAASKIRVALRDENGPWRHGSVYLYVLDTVSNMITVHGANPDRYELRPLVATVRDVVTGELVLPQVIKAAKSSPEGGFVEYYFDDPTDDTDSADIPKVGYAREFTGEFQWADGMVVSISFIVGSGFYGSAPDDASTVTRPATWGQIKSRF